MDPRSSKANSRPTVPGAQPDKSFLGPPEQPDEIGRLGPYRILAELGRGGMGAVYRAEDPTLRRQVAIKVMAPHIAADPQARARFIREAQAQAQVQHDRITPIYHAGESNGVAYLVMPLLKGQTLTDLLDEQPRLPVSEVLRIGREMAEGLAAAHAAKLIHRDIKPGNVWLEGDKQRVKILDFGLACVAGDSDRLTVQGMVVGTAAYMAPEQARGKPVDHRCDLWSLGVVLYQMTTGEKPFTGQMQLAVLYAITHTEPPAANTLAPEIPVALSDLITRLLSKDPAARPQSATEVADELAAIERTFATGSVPMILSEASASSATNPLANLDATGESESDVKEEEENQASAPKPRRKRKTKPASKKAQGQSRLLIGAIALALVVTVGLAVLISQATKPKTSPEVTEQPKPQPQPPAPQPKPKIDLTQPKGNPPTVSDPDREAAKILNPRAYLGLKMSSGQTVSVKPGDPLPTAPFELYDVNFSGDTLPDNYAAEVFFPAVSRLKLLTYVRMRSAQLKLKPEQLREMAAMPFASLLWSLEAEVYLTPESLVELKKFPKLAHLRLRLSDGDDTLIARLSELPKLRCLIITRLESASRITQKGWEAFAKSGIEHVVLGDTGSATSTIFRALTMPGGPQGLELIRCDLTDADLAALAQNPTNLARLYIIDSPKVTNAGLKHLEKVVSLTHLNVTRCGTTQAGLTAFATARPKVEFQKSPVRPNPSTGEPLLINTSSTTATDPDRIAAELLIPRAELYLRMPDGSERRVKPGGSLPTEQFTISQIDLLYDALPANYRDEVFLSAIAKLKSLFAIRMAHGQLRLEAEHLRKLTEMPFANNFTWMGAAVTLTPAAITELKKFPKLNGLRCRLSEADDALLGRLAELSPLEHLTLFDLGEKITRKGWEAVAKLRVNSVGIEDAGSDTAMIFRALTAPSGPRQLAFTRCPLTDADLATLVQSGTKIDALYIQVTDGVTNAGLKHLEKISTLKLLGIAKTKIADEELKAFRARTGLRDPWSDVVKKP